MFRWSLGRICWLPVPAEVVLLLPNRLLSQNEAQSADLQFFHLTHKPPARVVIFEEQCYKSLDNPSLEHLVISEYHVGRR